MTDARAPYYLTTAISYPNGEPHIGHAYEYIASDAMARFQRLDGRDVRFLTGTDEHGQKMEQTAQQQGVSALELATRNAAVFKEMDDDVLDISYDRFIRTTDTDHAEAVREIWRRMEANGDIYLGSYAGWYSVRDERYFGEDETEVGQDGVRRAVETGTEVTWTEEESYFFRLSKYQQPLLDHYREHPDFAAPGTASTRSSASWRPGSRTCPSPGPPSSGASTCRRPRTPTPPTPTGAPTTSPTSGSTR